MVANVDSTETMTERWLKARIEFESGQGNLKELAKRHNLSYFAILKRAERQQWRRIGLTVSSKVAKAIESKADLWVNQTVERGFRYRSDIDATRSQSGSDASGNALLEPADIRTLAQAESVIDSMARRSLGLAERVDITTNGESLGDSFISAISKLRADPSTPVLSSEDVSRVIDAPQID